jgi:hypothetical protein
LFNKNEYLVKEFIDKRNSVNVLNELHKALRDNQHRDLAPNVSSILIQEGGYIKKLGVSAPWDLFTDNFGLFLAAYLSCNISPFGSPPVQQTVVDTAGANQNLRVSGTNSTGNNLTGTYAFNSNAVSMILGIDPTTVARSDYAIGTIAPGIGTIPSVGAGYGSGAVNFSTTSIPNGTGSSIDVVEGAVYQVQHATITDNIYSLCVARYNYTLLTVGIGEQVQVDTTWNI